MKKSIKSLILAVLVLLILGGGYFLAVKWEPAPNEENENLPQNTTEYILDEEIENIEYAQFNNEGKSYIIRNGEKVSIEGYESYIIDEDALSSALSNVCSVAISHKIESKESALSDYGLDKEGKSLVLKLKDGTQKKLVIGNSANFEGEYYAKLNETICTISDYEAQAILKNPDEYRRSDICTIDNTSVTEYEIKKGTQTIFAVHFDEESSNAEFGMAGYKMTYPYKGVIASSDKINAIAEKLTSLSAVTIVEENPKNLAAYGLDSPYTLTVKDANGKVTVKMGDYAGDNTVYVMQGDLPVVYIAECPFYEIVKEAKAQDYIDRLIHIFNIENVSGITISADGKSYDLSITKKGEDEYSYKINGKHSVEKNFKAVYQKIIGVTAAEFSEKEVSGTEKCTITFKFTDGSKKAFKYYIYDERYSIVKANNGMTCLTLTKNIDEILEKLK